MISKKLLYSKVLGLAVAALTFVACTDTWDDHYESLGSGTNSMHEGSLWQAISTNSNLSNFASVLEACNYKPVLDGSQVFTVFAPTNDQFTQAQAEAWINDYKQQVAANVPQKNNTVLKEFVQNHIALYNHSVSSLRIDSIVMMNGKYAVLSDTAINGVKLLDKNQLYENGVLYTLDKQVNYLPTVFEYVSKDSELDSLSSFLYNPHYYYREFDPGQSVPGSIVDGKMQYLDSVFYQINELFSWTGRINSEDSTYLFLAPKNDTWKELVEKYEPYFNYPERVANRDSLVYTMPRLAVLAGSSFSRTFNSDEQLQDSAMSTEATINYVNRKSQWFRPFEYYQYFKPLEAKGAMGNVEKVQCSNGEVLKTSDWNITDLNTFNSYIFSVSKIKEVSKVKDQSSTNTTDSIETIMQVLHSVASDSKFFDKLWGNQYIEFDQRTTTMNHSVTYILPNVLSNMGYDIYLVTAPALAGDSTASEFQRLPTEVRCTVFNPGKGEEQLMGADGTHKTFVTTKDAIDYILLAENYQFNTCTLGVTEDDLQACLKIETRVGNADIRNNKKTRTMRINCILLVPHGTLEIVDALPSEIGSPAVPVAANHVGTPGVLLYPHGKYTDRSYKAWYLQR